MALGDWLQAPRRLIALFLLVTLVPSLALVFSGGRLLEQDRELSLGQLSERREQAADLAVSELERVVALTEQALGNPQTLRSAAEGDDDVVGVAFGADRVEAFPNGRLTFYPRTEAGIEAPAERFAEGEQFEFRQQALPEAIQVYRGLARSPNPALRAGALIRMARPSERRVRRISQLVAQRESLSPIGCAVPRRLSIARLPSPPLRQVRCANCGRSSRLSTSLAGRRIHNL